MSCSIPCYRRHKVTHDGSDKSTGLESAPLPQDRPGTKQRAPKVDFTDFENDKDFQRLLSRYPLLKVQLQSIYALTLEPGPEDARSWNRECLPGFELSSRMSPNRGRGRGSRGRGRGGRDVVLPEMRQRGQWTQSKGDREALDVIKKMREDGGDARDVDNGMDEFITLCRMKFGSEPG